jgi:hypothetical protein
MPFLFSLNSRMLNPQYELNPEYAIGNLFRATIAAKYATSLDFDSSP